MKAEEIVAKILEAKPNLPEKEILLPITLKWNKKDLSVWDGGFDLNDELRQEVVKQLVPYFRENNPDFAAILRFLLQQETLSCYEYETSTWVLTECYNSLSELRFLEDIILLLEATEASFDAHCALYKNRMFLNGYKNVMKYLNSNKRIEKDDIERIQYQAAYFGYDQKDSEYYD